MRLFDFYSYKARKRRYAIRLQKLFSRQIFLSVDKLPIFLQNVSIVTTLMFLNNIFILYVFLRNETQVNKRSTSLKILHKAGA